MHQSRDKSEQFPAGWLWRVGSKSGKNQGQSGPITKFLYTRNWSELSLKKSTGSHHHAQSPDLRNGKRSLRRQSRAKGPTSTHAQDFEPFNKAMKDKKKKQYRKKRDFKEPKDFNTPASGVNAAKVGSKRKKNKKDVSKVTYFNCNKKGHYANWYPK